MLCFRCGSPVEDSAKTCKNCGQDLTGSSSSPDAEQFSEIQKKLRQTGREWTRPASYKVGEVVRDRYEIKSVVGNGATGMVYKAFDQEVEVDVALKVIGSEFLPDEDARRDFMARIAPARELIHDNVVRTFELEREGDHCFAVMQFLEGLTLRKVIKLRRDKGQRFALSEVEPIAAQLCRAIGDTHGQMAHGGLKPENVIILPDLLKITDFGLARALPRPAFLAAQRAAGDAHFYLAPEIRARADFDARADVYALGAILVELLTGATCTGSGSADGLRTIEELPDAVGEVLRRALSERIEERQVHGGELGQELVAAVTGKRLRATQPLGAAPRPRSAHEERSTLPYGAARATPEPEERATQPYGARRGGAASDATGSPPPPPDDLTPTPAPLPSAAFGHLHDTQPVDGGPLGAPPEAEEPTSRISASELTSELEPPDMRIPDFKDPSVPAAPKAGSQVTHQLEVDEIEFASQKERLERLVAEAEGDEEILFKPPAGEPRRPDEPTDRLSAAALAAAQDSQTAPIPRAEVVAVAQAPSASPPAAGPSEGTQQISADMIVPQDPEPEEEELQTGRVRITSAGEVIRDPAASSASEQKGKEVREARARDALQAFDFDAALEDAVVSAAQPKPEAAAAEPELPEPEAAEPPEPTSPRQTARVRAATPLGIAPEVLHRDAVPAPLSPDVTMAIPRRVRQGRGVLPSVIVAFVAAVVLSTVGVIYYIHRQREEATRLELENKRRLALLLAKPDAQAALRPAATQPAAVALSPDASSAPTSEPAGPERVALKTEPEEPKAAPPKPEPGERPKPEPKRGELSKHEAKAKAEPKEKPEPKAKVEAKAKVEPKEKPEPKEAPAKGEKKCAAGMAFIPGRAGEDGYCIDRHEHPGKGRAPTHGITVAAARAACKARGQRLCTAKEWLRSCGSLFPYGKAYDGAQCNTGSGAVAASGSKKGCRSRYGIFDLSGNVSEWVEEGVAMGGDAKSEQGHASCPARSGGGPLTGFRCCADTEWE